MFFSSLFKKTEKLDLFKDSTTKEEKIEEFKKWLHNLKDFEEIISIVNYSIRLINNFLDKTPKDLDADIEVNLLKKYKHILELRLKSEKNMSNIKKKITETEQLCDEADKVYNKQFKNINIPLVENGKLSKQFETKTIDIEKILPASAKSEIVYKKLFNLKQKYYIGKKKLKLQRIKLLEHKIKLDEHILNSLVNYGDIFDNTNNNSVSNTNKPTKKIN